MLYKLNGKVKEEAPDWATRKTPRTTLQNWSAKGTAFSAAIQTLGHLELTFQLCPSIPYSGDQKTPVTVVSRNLSP